MGIEGELQVEVRARLTIKCASDGPDETKLIHELQKAGLNIHRSALCVDQESDSRTLEFEVSEMRRPRDITPPVIVHHLLKVGVRRLGWTPQT
jgi:hypothetical protein